PLVKNLLWNFIFPSRIHILFMKWPAKQGRIALWRLNHREEFALDSLIPCTIKSILSMKMEGLLNRGKNKKALSEKKSAIQKKWTVTKITGIFFMETAKVWE